MFKSFISHHRTWLTMVIMAYGIVGSCDGRCKKKDAIIPYPTPSTTTSPTAPPAIPTEKVNAANLNGSTDSLVTSSDSEVSDDSTTSSRSASSESSSGYGSSSGSFSPTSYTPPPVTSTDFAGLTNIGNTCYMNAVLQVIAALYADKVEGSPLKAFIHKINTTHGSLNGNEIQDLVSSFPEQAKGMVNLKAQQDPDEFITALNETQFLSPIHYTDYFLFKIESRGDAKDIFQKQLPKDIMYTLQIGFNQESTAHNLTEMIASSREELVEDEGIEIDSWNDYAPYNGAKSSFLEEHASSLKLQQGDRLKQYIKQQMIEIDAMPSKLYVQLKRFSNTSSKIKHQVHGTMNITIHPDPNQEVTVSFDLNGFIIHNGEVITSGHYIAYVKREGKWYEANDTVIRPIEQTKAIEASKQAYLLFYTKK